MNKQQYPILWDTFTETEKIAWICEKVIGLEIVSQQEDLRRRRYRDMSPRFAIYSGGQFILRGSDGLTRSWNPLSNVNDALEAERTLINSNVEMKTRYCVALTTLLQIGDLELTPNTILKLTQASGQIRSEAMFLALNQEIN